MQENFPNSFQISINLLPEKSSVGNLLAMKRVSKKNLGLAIARRRAALHFSQDGLGKLAGVNGQTVSNIETGKVYPQPETFHLLAEALGVTVQELDEEARTISRPATEHEEAQAVRNADVIMPDAEAIPFFDLPIAAGGWSLVMTDDNDMDAPRPTLSQINRGLFRVRVRGDSMEPKYQDRDIIEFQTLRNPEGVPDCARVKVGRDYYVQLDDGTGTLKRLAVCDERGLVLQAVNVKYKKPLVAPFDRIVKLAVVRGVFVPNEEE